MGTARHAGTARHGGIARRGGTARHRSGTSQRDPHNHPLGYYYRKDTGSGAYPTPRAPAAMPHHTRGSLISISPRAVTCYMFSDTQNIMVLGLGGGAAHMIAWRDGLERGPDDPVRQVPTRHVWTSTVWVTKHQTWHRKAPILQSCITVSGIWSWAWAPEIMSLGEDEMGNSGYALDWFTSVERAITLAWCRCRRRGGSTSTIRNRKPAEPPSPSAKWLAWDTRDATVVDGDGGRWPARWRGLDSTEAGTGLAVRRSAGAPYLKK